MFRLTALLVAPLLLSACGSTANSSSSQVSPDSSTPSPSTELPDVKCQGDIPDPLKATLSDYRLAQPIDFVPAIRQLDQQPRSPDFTFLYGNAKVGCSLVPADFNEDGQQDYALLLVNEKTSESQFRLMINQGNGNFESVVTRDYQKPPETVEGLVYTAMFFKPPGEMGSAKRKYFPLQEGTSERTTFVAKPAIELWQPSVASSPSQELKPENFQLDNFGHSSEVFYFVDGQLKTIGVSD